MTTWNTDGRRGLRAKVGPALGDGVRSAGRRVVRGLAMATADARPLPEVVVVGVKRGGTTSLFRDLERHPSMLPLVPSAARLPLRENQKGVHYFDTAAHRSDRWYRSHFAARPTRALRRRSTGAAFTAEASPYYFFQPTAARRVASSLPDATFVVLLRDPVERTISHWAEQTRNGTETLGLADALDAEDARVGDAAHRLRTGDLDVSFAHEQQSYAAQSEYADSLQRWFDAAGPGRVLVDFSETYYADPTRVLDRITDRLGVERIGRDVGEHRNAASRPSTVDPSIEARLVERFSPDVARVAELLGVTPPWPRFGGTDPSVSAGSSVDR